MGNAVVAATFAVPDAAAASAADDVDVDVITNLLLLLMQLFA